MLVNSSFSLVGAPQGAAVPAGRLCGKLDLSPRNPRLLLRKAAVQDWGRGAISL
jgi:hypothetical protein